MAEYRSRPSITVVLVGVLVLAGLAIGGTILSHAIASQRVGATQVPRAGDCWKTTFAEQQKSEAWSGSSSITCAKAHQSYTYAMTKLVGEFNYSSWRDINGNIRTNVDQAAFDACALRQTAILPGITAKEALLNPTYYLPSVAQWQGGARWVRCDVTLIRIGSTIAHPALADLPAFAIITSTLATKPAEYALCEDDPANNGPDGAQTTYADCTGSSDLTLLGQLIMDGASGTPYPSDAALASAGTKLCSTFSTPKKHLVVPEPPTQLEWTKYDDRYVDCWLNNN